MADFEKGKMRERNRGFTDLGREELKMVFTSSRFNTNGKRWKSNR